MKTQCFSPAAVLAGAVFLAAACGAPRLQPEDAPVMTFPLVEACRVACRGPLIPRIIAGPNGLVLLAAKSGILQAFDPEKPETEALRWTYTGSLTAEGPVVSEDRIVWATADGRILGIDETGLEVWTQKLDEPVRGELRLIGNRVVFLEGESFLSALNPVDGEILWRVPISSPLDWTEADNRIILRTTDGRLCFFQPDGRLVREFPIVGAMGGDFGVFENTAYFGFIDGYLRAINLSTGKIRWSIRIGGVPVGSPVTESGMSMIALSSQIAAAFKSKRGDILWWKPLAGRAAFSPRVIGEYVFISSRSPQLQAVSLKSFEMKVAFDAGGEEILAPPTAVGSKICLVTGDEAEGKITLVILHRILPAPPETPQKTDPTIIKK